jgi:CheY-like chemotaxis protein
MPRNLVIDDDEQVRDVTRRLLARAGYQAFAADSGARGFLRAQLLDAVAAALEASRRAPNAAPSGSRRA